MANKLVKLDGGLFSSQGSSSSAASGPGRAAAKDPLPEELMWEIFSRLELKARCRLQVCSKQWAAQLPSLCQTPSSDRARHFLPYSDVLRDLVSYMLPGELVIHTVVRLTIAAFGGNDEADERDLAFWLYVRKCHWLQLEVNGNLHAMQKEHIEARILPLRNSLRDFKRRIHSNDEKVLIEACCSLSHISGGGNERIRAVIEAGVCEQLVNLLFHPSPNVLILALRTIGNIVSGDYAQTQVVIDAGFIPHLIKLLRTAKLDVKKESVVAILNATSGATNDQIKYLVTQGCVEPLCDLLSCPDPGIITVCLEGLENILRVGEVEKHLANTEDVNNYAQLIDKAEGLKKIVHLQRHESSEIYKKAMKILETYWLEELDDTLPSGGGAPQPSSNFGGSDDQLPSGRSQIQSKVKKLLCRSMMWTNQKTYCMKGHANNNCIVVLKVL